MGPEDSFYQAIVAEPDNETLRLIYADYLDDHPYWPGASEWAEFIRAQCELLHPSTEIRRRCELQNRAVELLRQQRIRWNGSLHRFLGRTPLRGTVSSRRGLIKGWSYQRGFVESLHVQARAFVEHADILFQLGPIREVKLFRASGVLGPVAACSYLDRLRVLDLSGNHIRPDELRPLQQLSIARSGSLRLHLEMPTSAR